MPLTRVWGMLTHWSKHPPIHRLFAMFVGYEATSLQAKAPDRGFEISSLDLEVISGGRQHRACRQSQLDANTRKRIEPFQSTEAYKEFHKNWRSKLDARKKDG